MLLKTSTLALAFALAIGSGAAFAADAAKPAKPLTAQQERMKNCNADAKTKALAGADRKAFMKTCLSGTNTAAAAPAAAPVVTAKQTQQEKMKTCSTDAKDKKLKGADRKTYMSTCLKGDGAAAPAH
ncbi:MAG: PsiF family protein [Dokdonella sp.]